MTVPLQVKHHFGFPSAVHCSCNFVVISAQVAYPTIPQSTVCAIVMTFFYIYVILIFQTAHDPEDYMSVCDAVITIIAAHDHI